MTPLQRAIVLAAVRHPTKPPSAVAAEVGATVQYTVRVLRRHAIGCAPGAPRAGRRIGQRAYHARQRGAKWVDIAREVGAASSASAMLSARHYALNRALHWPPSQGT